MTKATSGYTFFTIYRGYGVWHNPNPPSESLEYGATREEGEAPKLTVFGRSFGEIRAELDEVAG